MGDSSPQVPTCSDGPALVRGRGSLFGTSSEKKSSQFQKSQTLPSSEKNPEKHKEDVVKKEVECNDEIILIDSDLSGNNFSDFLKSIHYQNNVLVVYMIFA